MDVLWRRARERAWILAGALLACVILLAPQLSGVVERQREAAYFASGPSFWYSNSPFPMRKVSYRPGEVLQVEIARCSRLDHEQPYIINRQLARADTDTTQPSVIALQPLGFTVVPGCAPASLSVAHRVPCATPPGPYTLHLTAQITGPYGVEIVAGDSQPFRVESSNDQCQTGGDG